MECYLGHLSGVLVSLKHYLGFTWVLYYDKISMGTHYTNHGPIAIDADEDANYQDLKNKSTARSKHGVAFLFSLKNG